MNIVQAKCENKIKYRNCDVIQCMLKKLLMMKFLLEKPLYFYNNKFITRADASQNKIKSKVFYSSYTCFAFDLNILSRIVLPCFTHLLLLFIKNFINCL